MLALLIALAASSGISGTVATAPTCPVERLPPDPSCAPRRLAGAEVTVVRRHRRVATTHSDSDGRFRLSLAPGRYVVRASTGHALPRPETRVVRVRRGKVARVRMVLDSGIR
ncbi:MAG: carboxypeptidase-like regulatory domain-containing protein [Thermoleophilaceae bacterium]